MLDFLHSNVTLKLPVTVSYWNLSQVQNKLALSEQIFINNAAFSSVTSGNSVTV